MSTELCLEVSIPSYVSSIKLFSCKGFQVGLTYKMSETVTGFEKQKYEDESA